MFGRRCNSKHRFILIRDFLDGRLRQDVEGFPGRAKHGTITGFRS